jgi:hypothetical protein
MLLIHSQRREEKRDTRAPVLIFRIFHSLFALTTEVMSHSDTTRLNSEELKRCAFIYRREYTWLRDHMGDPKWGRWRDCCIHPLSYRDIECWIATPEAWAAAKEWAHRLWSEEHPYETGSIKTMEEAKKEALEEKKKKLQGELSLVEQELLK